MIIQPHPGGDRRTIRRRARKSVTQPLARKRLGRRRRSRRDSGGGEAAMPAANFRAWSKAAVAAIPGGVRRPDFDGKFIFEATPQSPRFRGG